MKFVFSVLIMCSSFLGISQEKASLTIEFELTKFKNGNVFVAVYNTEESFLKEAKVGSIIEVQNGKATAVFEHLDYGIYAVSSFYDKNDNGKLDTNFLGIPKEPTAMSNNAKGSFGPPKFKDAKFKISSSNKVIKIKY